MHGRQINFFLSIEDQRALNDLLSRDKELVFADALPNERNVRIRSSSIVSRMGEERLKIFLIRRSDLPEIQYLAQGAMGFDVDILRSPTIEYSRCYVADGIIRRGRMYYKARYYGADNNEIDKSADFLTWAAGLFKSATRLVTRTEDGDYVGRGAATAQANGVKLSRI